MGESPETLQELAQYLRNSANLFPNPRTRKAFEWLTIKADEADDHAAAWKADRKRLQALRQMYLELAAVEDQDLDAIVENHISAQEAFKAE